MQTHKPRVTAVLHPEIRIRLQSQQPCSMWSMIVWWFQRGVIPLQAYDVVYWGYSTATHITSHYLRNSMDFLHGCIPNGTIFPIINIISYSGLLQTREKCTMQGLIGCHLGCILLFFSLKSPLMFWFHSVQGSLSIYSIIHVCLGYSSNPD